MTMKVVSRVYCSFCSEKWEEGMEMGGIRRKVALIHKKHSWGGKGKGRVKRGEPLPKRREKSP